MIVPRLVVLGKCAGEGPLRSLLPQYLVLFLRQQRAPFRSLRTIFSGFSFIGDLLGRHLGECYPWDFARSTALASDFRNQLQSPPAHCGAASRLPPSARRRCAVLAQVCAVHFVHCSKSLKSVRNTVAFTTRSRLLPPASRMAFRFSSTCVVCSVIPAGHNLLRCRVQWNLSGREDQISRTNALRVRPDGRRSAFGCNHRFAHLSIVLGTWRSQAACRKTDRSFSGGTVVYPERAFLSGGAWGFTGCGKTREFGWY